MAVKEIDLITIGRSSVDLYGNQVGGRLEDMLSFSKYIGGSPTNIAIGVARLGLRSCLITRVGDEQMGRFITEQLKRENVDDSGVVVDKDRLTALVVLGIKDEESFPHIFYRENCADMALCESNIDENLIKSSKCVLITGVHLSTNVTAEACKKAITLGKASGAKIVLDIDYRPNLWGLAGHKAGEERFIKSDKVTEVIQQFLPLLDLVVGTKEEIHIAGGSTNTLEALKNIRTKTDAVIVCKLGTAGATVFEDQIPASINEGISVPGIEIEVFNVLGAGDGFMSGLLRGWINEESWQTSLQWANICGAFAVSRHGCAPSYPSWDELQYFLENGSKHKALRKDAMLEHIHWATNRPVTHNQVRTFAFDHKTQFKAMTDEAGIKDYEIKIGEFKKLALKAACQVSKGRMGYGILCDSLYGKLALYASTDHNLWVARPVEVSDVKPLQFEIGPDLGSELKTWPAGHIAKVLVQMHPDDSEEIWEDQLNSVHRLYDACRQSDHEMLFEIIIDRSEPIDADTTSILMQRIYASGIKPDWWKLEPLDSESGWQSINDTIEKQDKWCKGIVVLGMEATYDVLRNSFTAATKQPYVKGFAVGRTLFAEVAKKWFNGELDDKQAVDQMDENYTRLCSIWDEALSKNNRI